MWAETKLNELNKTLTRGHPHFILFHLFILASHLVMSFRLLDIVTGEITSHPLAHPPPYLAVSHTWSENWFPSDKQFSDSPGREAIVASIYQRFSSIRHCWVDTICILQGDDADKQRQIPLMGGIFSGASAVIIILNTNLAMNQDEIDGLTEKLQEAVEMAEEQTWTSSDYAYWQSGPGRQLIVQGMVGLGRLTTTAWSTRVWTLQEYIYPGSRGGLDGH